ncbi:hypothetical protein BFR69_02940 [Acinetobacter pittii]|jgi:hypothetical protein|nr:MULTISPECIES: hypothetical protein [Acinetobacter]OIF97189.1 hypothetical protein A7N09_33985 [Acinetobacter baumannii]AUT33610.1 hypothetical protein C2U64_07030 [Acinetobacter pittii]AVN17638.1 hypothetical protein C6N19_06640 [Acinetobacter pittii]AVN21349.1 hypothetical protein C6N17_06075 [Acinetobacter pittii]EFF86542.1 hypothetical protein HMPREF0013_01876 [Acinetobacter sp. SH024]
MNSLKKLIKDKSPWLSVFDAFNLIKNKTDLELDYEIAELLISIEINEFCIPYDKSHYFDGNPVRLHRDFDNKQFSKMDYLLINLASGSITIDDFNLDFKNYVWFKDDFFYQFEHFTEINLENSEQRDKIYKNKTLDESKTFPLYFKNEIFSVHEASCLMTGYNPTSTSRCSNKVSWLEQHPEYEEAFDFIYSAVKSGFFGEFVNEGQYLEANRLKEFFSDRGIYIDGFNKNIEPNYIMEQTKLKDYQRENQELALKINKLEQKLQQEILQSQLLQSDYQSSQAEIKNLKSVISEKDKTIQKLKDDVQKENGEVFCLSMDLNSAKNDFQQLKLKYEDLEAKLLISTPSSTLNILDQIFDESATERYSPDLVLSIKLWESIYINNPKNDSHSNKANSWITMNTGYDLSRPSATKLREITTPFINWSTHRDRNYKK